MSDTEPTPTERFEKFPPMLQGALLRVGYAAIDAGEDENRRAKQLLRALAKNPDMDPHLAHVLGMTRGVVGAVLHQIGRQRLERALAPTDEKSNDDG